MENKFILSEEEKNRILNLHEKATKKNYLNESMVSPTSPVSGGNSLSGTTPTTGITSLSEVKPPIQPVKLQTTINSLGDVLKGQYLHFGTKGNGVKELQIKLGINPPNEYFGAKTKQSVISFQEKNGLTPDGIVGPKTYTALQK
jgi:peptidoglycan hydrolase-like protein with peptidoglycan-binding domain